MHPDLPIETTLEVRDRCLCLSARRAARRVARVFDEALKAHGITNGQFSLLMSLNRPAPPRLTDLTELLGMDRTTLTAAVKVLERRGLMRQVQDSQDRRAKRLILTREGEAVLIAALPVWRETQGRIEAALEALEPAVLRNGLDALGRG